MAYTPPTITTQVQPEGTRSASDGSKSETIVRKGDKATLLTEIAALVIGTTVSPNTSLPLQSWTLRDTVAGLATLTLTYGEDENNDGAGNASVLSESWSMKHTQRIVSLMRRTGASASMPNRGNLEAWSKEPDPELYDAFQYRTACGSVMTLSAAEQAVAAKLARGITGAMRFYPTVQHVRQYTKGKIAGVGTGLARISTPGSPWDTAAASWLKVGDDVTYDVVKGVQTRTESWMGAASWDADLYGPNAWNLDD